MSVQLPFKTSHAFIIGINDYQYISPLKTAVNDAKGIASRLEAQHDYVVHPPVLNPDKAELDQLFQEIMPQKVGKEDRVIVYFAGHGIALDGEEGPNGYIVPADAKQGEKESLVPMDSLHQTLNELPCQHGLLILDCCFSGAFKWSTGYRDIVFDLPKVIYEERFWRYVKDPAWQVITSSAYDQKAVDVISNQSIGMREEGQGSHSPFAHALFEALEGAADVVPADQGDGVITASELYAYLRDTVETETTDKVKRQSPSMFNLGRHDKGEFIFLNPRHRFNLPPTPDRNPFMGLASYNEADSHFFFGRDRVTEALYEKVQKHSLTVVSGASGTGKSSVIKAGLLPKLRKEGWEQLAVIRPGKEPMEVLADEIGDISTKLNSDHYSLLIIDQYEELITQTLHEEDRTAFEQQLADWISAYPQLRIILSVRSDFEPQFESHELAPWWQAGRYIVPAFSGEEIREVITQPALQAVLFYEPIELADKLEEDVAQAPGALPLLSFTLSELYYAYLKSGRQDRALTLADYEALGGVIGALRTKADEAYSNQDEAHQNSLRHLMLRMVSLEGGELAGKRVYVEELGYSDASETDRIQRVARELVDARLILRGKDLHDRIYLEPAHDALVRAWARLWEWIKAIGEEKLIWQNKLSQAVGDYHELLESNPSKAKHLLWNNNPRLDILKAELQESNHMLNAQEENFVRMSVKRRTARQRQLIGSLVAALVIFAGLAFWANGQRVLANESAELAKRRSDTASWAQELAERRADTANWAQELAARRADTARTERNRANQEAKEAKSTAYIAMAREKNLYDPTTALNIAFAAYRFNPTELTRTGLGNIGSSQGNHYARQILKGSNGRITDFTLSKDGEYLLTANSGISKGRGYYEIGSVSVWSLKSGEEIRVIPAFENTVNALDISSDGKWVVTGDGSEVGIEASLHSGNKVKIWSLQEKGKDKLLGKHEAKVRAVAFHPDNKHVISGSADGTSKLWSIETGEVLHKFKGHRHQVGAVKISPDGKTMISGSADGSIILWSLDSAKQIRQFRTGNRGFVRGIAFSTSGDSIAMGWDPGTQGQKKGVIYLFSTKSEEPIREFQGHKGGIYSLDFSKDGTQILSSSKDGTVKMWNIRDGQEIKQFLGHEGVVYKASFSIDGKSVITGGEDQKVRIWPLKNSFEIQEFGQLNNKIVSATFHTTRSQFLIAYERGQILVKTIDSDNSLQFRYEEGRIRKACFSPSNQSIIVLGDKGIRFYQAENGYQLSISLQEKMEDGRYKEWETNPNDIVVSPNGKMIATIGRHIIVWSISTGKEIARFPDKSKSRFRNYSFAAFSADGERILAKYPGEYVEYWSIKTGANLLERHYDEKKQESYTKTWPSNNINEMEEGVKFISSAAFTANGKYFLLGYEKHFSMNVSNAKPLKVLRLFSTKTGKEVHSFPGINRGVKTFTFSSDDQLVLSGAENLLRYDTPIQVWSVQTGEELFHLRGHEDDIKEVDFSRNKKYMLTVDDGGIAKLWINFFENWPEDVYKLDEEEKKNLSLEVDY